MSSDFDHDARRQIRELLDQSFLVEAGAGTGKTSALVDRVVALVLGGRKIERIVAITFTERAAAELRDRVRWGLEAKLDEESLEPEETALVEEALSSLDRSHISTIHSFCQAILRQFAPELSVDPAYDVQDEVLADRRFEEVWRLRLDELGRQADARTAVDRALDLGLTTRDIANLVSSLWKQPEVAPLLHARPLLAPAFSDPDLGGLLLTLQSLPMERVAAEDRLRPRIESLISSLEALLRSPDQRDALLGGMAGVLSQSYNVGQQGNWGKETLQQARAAAQAAVEALSQLLAHRRAEALAGILRYVVDFVIDDEMARGREGKLVFDDLILRVRELLLERPIALRAIRERFDCLLIDEFQDTDPFQVDIARAFATDPETGRLESGRLFLVGDPKQSIYRFRRADMAVYSAVRSVMDAAGGLMPGLTQNRRSRQPIIDWVNRVFAEVIGPGEAQEFQPPYREIKSSREGALAGPGVAWFGGAVEAPAREVRRHEAAAIAARIRAAIDEEGWEVEERPDRQTRPAAFRDVAVLVPTRTILMPLERALQEAGVPYRVEGGSLVYGTQEVRDIINCLTAIDDPADEVAVVGALRSPAYACSDVEIARFKLDGGRFDYLHRSLESRSGAVAIALSSLRSFHGRRHEGSIASLVERFLADRGLAEAGILDQASRNSFRRCRFVVEQARAFEAAGPESLRGFVSWLERRSGKAVLDNEGAGLDDDEDAVRVLTIHAAKGLEFPIVFVAGLGWSPGADRRVFALDRTTGEIAVSLGALSRGAQFTLGPVDQVNNQEVRHLRAERDRLLYVAATRARDHLVLSLYHKQGASECAAVKLIEAGAREGAQELLEPTRVVKQPWNALAALDVDAVGAVDHFEAERERLAGRAKTVRFTSATALGPYLKKETSDETEPWARGRGRTHVGRAVHAALQSVAWDAGDDEIEAIARAQAVAEAVPDRAVEVAGLVRRALRTAAADRARSARRALREVPFALPLGGLLVEGFADVVVDSEDGLEIVDWKTDDVSASEARERLREYELQAGLYVLGLEAATARQVQRLTYVFVRPGLELSPGDPAELARQARLRVLASDGK